MTYNEKKNLWRKTKSGLLAKSYSAQLDACRKRNHPMPTYTLDEFREWVLAQDVFHELFNAWTASGHAKDLIPSTDRLDNSKSYSFDNLQIVTFKQNRENVYRDRKSGVVKTIDKAILQFSKAGEFIAEYFSIAEAARESKLHSQNISLVAKGKRKTSGGFIWKFKESI